MVKGNYRVELSNKLGQVVFACSIHIDQSTRLKVIQPDKVMASGSNQLSVTSDDRKKTIETIIVP